VIAVRPLQAADLPWVIELDRKTPGGPHWSAETYQSLPGSEDRLEKLRYFAVAAEHDSVPAGVMIARLLLDGVENACELEWVAVEDGFRRRGVARRLLQGLEEWASGLGGRRILLEVRAGNEAARALYRRAGFCQTGLRRRYYADPEEDAVLMTKELAAVENKPQKAIEEELTGC
jgi:ribosomal-protein-alanine N-acetyltransferase